MISLLLSFVLGIIVILCLVVKMKRRHLSQSLDNVICIVIPIVCLLTFISIMVETTIRRNASARELEKMLSVVDSNSEKSNCLDSLRQYSERVRTIAYDDSLISLVVGQDTCMQKRVERTDNAITQTIKRVSSLNDFCDDNK